MSDELVAASPLLGEGKSGVLDARLAPVLDDLRARSLYRVRRVVEGGHAVRMRVDGRDCINFCSNDYLGLATDPRVAEAASKAFARVGTGSSGSALISGYNAEHRALEEELADFLGRPRALLFSTGWATNMGVLKALLGRGDAVIAEAEGFQSVSIQGSADLGDDGHTLTLKR